MTFRYAVTSAGFVAVGQTSSNRARSLSGWFRQTPAALAMLAEERAILDALEGEHTCHCGAAVTFGYDGDPTHHRGMCSHCDSVRCDAYPGECDRGDVR